MTLIVLLSIVVGGGLLIAGARRFKHAPAQAVALIVSAALLNAWWLVFAGMAAFKFFVLKEDT